MESKTITPWICKNCNKSNPEFEATCKHCGLTPLKHFKNPKFDKDISQDKSEQGDKNAK